MPRKAGIPNRATVEKRLKAAYEIDAALAGGKPLAKDRIEHLGEIALEAMAVHQPVTAAMAKKAGTKPRAGSWSLFGEWHNRALHCFKELAKYQSPQLRAIAVAPVPENTAITEDRDEGPIQLKVFEGGRQIKAVIVGEHPK